MTRRVLIMGAAGRDFHNFNTVFRADTETEVVAFTATQIPFINDRTYPASLAGPRYPNGIKIHDESELSQLIRDLRVDEVVFAYSDVPHEHVMHKASEVQAAGASFTLLGPNATMLDASVPVVSVCAIRTGSGKSQTTRAIAGVLKEAGKRVVAVRHPMPYGDLEAQRVQRYATIEDLDRYETTIEEREEYEPHITSGTIIYAGVDYGEILEQAQAECDVLLWDGGNNDLPFYRPTVAVVVADPLRAGHETTYYPGETNLRMADVIVINKMDSASADQIERLEATIASVNPRATVVRADSVVSVDDPSAIAGKRVLVIEDGPTLTHGEMKFGAGVVAARQGGAAEIVDPRPWALGTIEETFRKYDVGPVLPAMGYSEGQLAEMEKIIDAADVDLVVIGTPIDLRRVITISKPAVRVRYDLVVRSGSPTLLDVLKPVL
jgi:predicted GTPase